MKRRDGKKERGEREDVPFEIRERTFQFAVRVVKLVRRLPKTLDAVEIGRQLIKSGASPAKRPASLAIGCASSKLPSSTMTRSEP
jgi:hypothetical protein